MKNKILLVDDEEAILHSFRRDLEMEDYEVSTAAGGEEALSMLRNNRYNLVITDLMMPGTGGIAILREAKKLDPAIGVFILTGFGDMTSAIDALRLGADDYLLKPYDTDELLIRISRCLEKQELQKKIKLYENILPVCMYCKDIRDDTGTEPGKGPWLNMANYLYLRSSTSVSHGICPKCYEIHKKDYQAHKKD